MLTKDKVTWLHPGTDLSGPGLTNPEDDSYTPLDPTVVPSRSSHGTAMLSLVAGKTLGVAKKANIVLARLPRRRRDYAAGDFTPEDWLDGLVKISSHILTEGKRASVVPVLVAQAFHKETWRRRNPANGDPIKDQHGQEIYDNEGWVMRCKTLLDLLATKYNVLAITGKSNDRLASVPYWPSAFAAKAEDQPLDSLLVVGAVSSDGQSLPYQVDAATYGIPHVFAPGDNVKVALGQPFDLRAGRKYNDDARGTSEGK